MTLQPARPLVLLTLLSMSSCRSPTDAKTDTFGLSSDDYFEDGDGDGFSGSEDCNDDDASQSPAAMEICDGIDNDCDGAIDEDVLDTWFLDLDGDGFGDPTELTESCAAPPDHVTNAEDCNDQDALAYPGAPESCDGIDNDCDGDIDEDGVEVWFLDHDGDGFGDSGSRVEDCERPATGVAVDGDCDDDDSAVHPDATEVCNERDDDCDDEIDEGLAVTWYRDGDGDGWGDVTSTTEACIEPAGHTADGGDCDDSDTAYHPGAPETDCTDPHDYNCDGSVAYADADGDGWAACTDCDDSEAAVNPDATEVCNSIDDDCDGDIDDADSSVDLTTAGEWYGDVDGDGYGNASDTTTACGAPTGFVGDDTDCDDGSASVNPGETEVCNSIDDDCDGDIDDADSSVDLTTGATWYADADRDGYGDAASTSLACDEPSGAVSDDTDCDDGDSAVHPNATEVCNSIDDDCDGDIDDDDSSVDLTTATSWYTDGDGDGYGGSTTTLACSQPSSTTATSTDCDDTDSAVHPGATEDCDGVDTDCDGSIDEGYSAVSSSISTASPTSSCNGSSNQSVSFTAASACGCPTVTMTGSFVDNSDGSSGQVTSVSTGSSSMTIEWDDAPSGGDCDLDIASSISWSASYSAGTMSVTVSDSITGYDAGNSLSAGYSITSYSTVRRSSGSGSSTYTYSCP